VHRFWLLSVCKHDVRDWACRLTERRLVQGMVCIGELRGSIESFRVER
jgi:hypothetical protein